MQKHQIGHSEFTVSCLSTMVIQESKIKVEIKLHPSPRKHICLNVWPIENYELTGGSYLMVWHCLFEYRIIQS